MFKSLLKAATTVVLLCCLPLCSLAQVRVSGTVLDGIEPLIGASVVVQGTTKGVVTDENGHFEIDVPENAQLVFSYVGYPSQTIKIDKNKPVLNVKMSSEGELPTTYIVEAKPSFNASSRHIVALTNSEMKEQGAISLSDALAKLPGVSQLTTGGISKPVIRGMYGNRLQINVLGMRFDNQQWQDEHGLGLSDMGVERVELIKGAAALMHGSDAMGGVVNVIEENFPYFEGDCFGMTKNPTEIQSLNLKTFSNTYGIGADYGYKKYGKNTLILRGGFESHGDYSDGNNTRILNTRFANYNFKAGYLISKSRFNSENRAHISFSQFGFILDTNERKAIDNRLSRTFDGPHHSVFFTLLTSKNTFFLDNSSKLIVSGGVHSNLRQEQEGGNRISLNMFLNTFTLKTDYEKTFGNDWRLINGIAGMLQTNTNYGSRIIVPDATTTEGSVYSYMRKSFLQNKLNLETGLRYDLRHIQTFLTSDLNLPTSPVAPFSRNFDALNGAFGLAYAKGFQWGSFDIKSDFATGFRSANLAELSADGLHEGTKRWEIGDVNLKTERCFNLDVSSNWRFDVPNSNNSQIILRGSVFRNRFLNYIYLSATGKEYVGFDIYSYKQSDAVLKGFEAGVAYENRTFKLSSDYSFLDARRDDGTWLPFTPANRLQNELKVYFLNRKNHFTNTYFKIGMTNVDPQNHPAEFEILSPKYTLFNAGIGTTYKHLRASITGNNLANKLYSDHLSRYQYFGIRDKGRDIVLTFSYQFLR
jgi:iron complex outermembrane recepter protein